MNALAIRRRWMIARPWIKDGLAGLLLVAFMVAAFRLMDVAAAICQALEFCS